MHSRFVSFFLCIDTNNQSRRQQLNFENLTLAVRSRMHFQVFWQFVKAICWLNSLERRYFSTQQFSVCQLLQSLRHGRAAQSDVSVETGISDCLDPVDLIPHTYVRLSGNFYYQIFTSCLLSTVTVTGAESPNIKVLSQPGMFHNP